MTLPAIFLSFHPFLVASTQYTAEAVGKRFLSSEWRHPGARSGTPGARPESVRCSPRERPVLALGARAARPLLVFPYYGILTLFPRLFEAVTAITETGEWRNGRRARLRI
jgi:hypothetical protein